LKFQWSYLFLLYNGCKPKPRNIESRAAVLTSFEVQVYQPSLQESSSNSDKPTKLKPHLSRISDLEII
jgi:hypothetical protein